MIDLESAKKTFFLESRENLKRIEENLLTLNENAHDSEFVNALFREVHTIKGSAGMFGFDELSKFAHIFESLLDSLRNAEIGISDDFLEISLDAHDQMKMLVDLAERETEPSEEICRQGDLVSERIESLLQEEKKETSDNGYQNKESDVRLEKTEALDKDISSVVSEDAVLVDENEEISKDEKISELHSYDEEEPLILALKFWHISLRLSENLFVSGIDPYSFIHYLHNLGSIINVYTNTESIPELSSIDAEKCYLNFEIGLDASPATSKEDIEQAFEFLPEGCNVLVFSPGISLVEYLHLLSSLNLNDEELLNFINLHKELRVITQDEYSTITSASQTDEKTIQKKNSTEKVKDSSIQREETIAEVKDKVDEVDKEKDQKPSPVEEKRERTLRVNAGKIDHLIALVGELVISGATIQQKTSHSEDTGLVEAVAHMIRLVDEIRDATMNVRMVPIGETFTAYRRVVHDLAKNLGKEVELKISGSDTELDKTLVEKIKDPLMHLVRNAVDHGIESPDVREESGKSRLAKLSLNSYYESGSVVIEVSDDGTGLSRNKIYSKCVEVGLIQDGELIEDRDLWQFITNPGFSTASEITDISGRGVGMDVVRKNIEKLRGLLDIVSNEGKGTTFRIHLPLTLAIIDGFLISVKDQKFVFPLDMVLECTDISLSKEDNSSGNFITLRGEVLPYLDLFDLFYTNAKNEMEHRDKQRVVIVEYARRRAGIVVESLFGEIQTVIKPLGRIFNNMKWISGATILGNGEVALIIDVPRLIDYARTNNER